MRIVFKNAEDYVCIFTEEGVSLYGRHQEGYYPYGCMDSICMSFFGELQINYGFNQVTFVPNKEDRAALRQEIKAAKPRLKTAQPEEAKVYVKCTKVPEDLPPEEQLKQYKELFSACTISKGYYDLKKRLLREE